jgi:hypothetical protein
MAPSIGPSITLVRKTYIATSLIGFMDICASQVIDSFKTKNIYHFLAI